MKMSLPSKPSEVVPLVVKAEVRVAVESAPSPIGCLSLSKNAPWCLSRGDQTRTGNHAFHWAEAREPVPEIGSGDFVLGLSSMTWLLTSDMPYQRLTQREQEARNLSFRIGEWLDRKTSSAEEVIVALEPRLKGKGLWCRQRRSFSFFLEPDSPLIFTYATSFLSSTNPVALLYLDETWVSWLQKSMKAAN